jgi:transcriptional regulator with XRE-family HTH domain
LTLDKQRKQRLSERLRSLMDQRGLSVSATAGLVREQLRGRLLNVANISHYRAGRSMPRPNVLRALSIVLDVEPAELTSTRAGSIETPPHIDIVVKDWKSGGSSISASIGATPKDDSSTMTPRFDITDLPGGEALLQINQKLPWLTAIRILQVLKEEL